MELERKAGSRLGVTAERIVKVQSEILAVGIYSDVRPLQGLSSEVDWVHNGVISRLIVKGKITGALKETTLIAAHHKFFCPKIMVVGLGTRKSFSETTIRDIYPFVFRVMASMNLQEIAVELLGEDLGPRAIQAGVESLGRELGSDPNSRCKVTLLAGSEDRARQVRQLILEKGEKT